MTATTATQHGTWNSRAAAIRIALRSDGQNLGVSDRYIIVDTESREFVRAEYGIGTASRREDANLIAHCEGQCRGRGMLVYDRMARHGSTRFWRVHASGEVTPVEVTRH